MKLAAFSLALAASLVAAPPMIRDLSPRGAQKGRPFTLTVMGQNLSEVLGVDSTMPATFTATTPEKADGRYASFLVEPKSDLAVGVYPIRLRTSDGISNIQLFAVGSFPELTEDESQPGGVPNTNDTVETAQSLPSTPLTINGKLRGAERDIYRLQIKAGEKRVFEVEGRRLGSAIDPVIRIMDQSGRMIARSEDTLLLGLDSRLEFTFPKEGYYYVEVADARFSTQNANFYRLKTGAYRFVTDVYPLGGRRGETVEVSLGDAKVNADLKALRADQPVAFVNLPEGAALPIPLDLGDSPELMEPLTTPASLPATINGRLSKLQERDQYAFAVNPGDDLVFEIRARELGTSKIMAVLEVTDEQGKVLARAGDQPLPDDFFSVTSSKTAGDPFVILKVPDGVRKLNVNVEDLALRGGPGYSYRLIGRRAANDFTVALNSPYVNIPAGGTVTIPVSVDRKGYMGDLRFRIANAPKGLLVEGGYIPPQDPEVMKRGNRGAVRRGVLFVTAEPGTRIEPAELTLEAVATMPDGTKVARKAAGPGMTVDVAGATIQGAVDRQKQITADWLGLELPASGTGPLPAELAVELVKTTRRGVGDEFLFRWKWTGRGVVTYPSSVGSELISAADTRAIEMKQDEKDPSTGTFLLTTTKLTLPGRYDFYVFGQLVVNGERTTIASRPMEITIQPPEENASVRSTSSR